MRDTGQSIGLVHRMQRVFGLFRLDPNVKLYLRYIFHIALRFYAVACVRVHVHSCLHVLCVRVCMCVACIFDYTAAHIAANSNPGSVCVGECVCVCVCVCVYVCVI